MKNANTSFLSGKAKGIHLNYHRKSMNGPILYISPVSKIAFLQFPVDFEKNHVEFDARISMWECGKVVGIKIWPFGDLWHIQI